MEKPIYVKVNEFREKLCDIINTSGLSSYIIINELSATVQSLIIKEQALEEEYNKSLKGSEEKCKK